MSEVHVIDERFAASLSAAGLDTVAGALSYRGGSDLDKPGLGTRRRTRLTLTDSEGRTQEAYLKRYGRETVRQRLRRWWTHGTGGTPARVECENIRAVAAAGVATMAPICWGQERPGGRSFLIVSAVPGEALERCGEAFVAGADDRRLAELTAGLAETVSRLHGAGLCHRDLYASHVFLREGGDRLDLYLIDLARVFAPRWRRRRWRVKDLAQIKYSMPDAWVMRCWGEFLSACASDTPAPVRERLDRAIDRKVSRMRRREACRADVGRSRT